MGFELNGAQHITSSDHHGEYRGCRQRQRLLSISKRAAPPGWVVYAHLLLLRDSGEAGKEDAPGSCAVGLLCVAKIVRQNYSRVEIEISLSRRAYHYSVGRQDLCSKSAVAVLALGGDGKYWKPRNVVQQIQIDIESCRRSHRV